MRLKAHVLMLFVVAIWGGTFVLIKDALQDISPLLFNLLRMILAFACLAALAVYRSHWGRLTPRAWASGAVAGFFLALGYQFQTAGLARTTPSKSAFLTGLVVVFVPLLSAIPALRPTGSHPPRWNAFLGALAAFLGIILLTSPTHSNGALFHLASVNIGDLLTLGCALGFALHCLSLAHTSPRVPFEQLALLQIGFCAVFMAVSTPLLEHPWIHPSWTHPSNRVIFAIVIAAVLATAAAFTVQSWAQGILPATHTALILTLEPVFAWLTSFFVLHERLGLRASAGALMILAGIGITELIPQTVYPTAHEGVPLE